MNESYERFRRIKNSIIRMLHIRSEDILADRKCVTFAYMFTNLKGIKIFIDSSGSLMLSSCRECLRPIKII